METVENQFRTTAFGGFQKQDVLNYIEASARKHSEQTAALTGELEQLRRGREELERQVTGGEARAAALEAENQQLRQDLERKSQALETAQREAAEKDIRLTQAEEELKRLREQAAALQSAADAYEKLKNRTAGMEMEAHARAQAVETEAQERARRTLKDLDQWLRKVQSGYGRIRTDLDATVAHAADELERVNKSLGVITAEFGEYDTQLNALLEDCRKGSGPVPPTPLPLDGE